MSADGLLPGFPQVITVVLLLATGFAAGSFSSYPEGWRAEQPMINGSSRYPETPGSELRQVPHGVKSGSYIQAPYTNVNFSIRQDSAEIDISAVAFPEGKSMRPTIFSENAVLLEKYHGGEIMEGQMLRYQSDGGFVIHRVQANYLDTAGYLLMKGDNNQYSARIDKEQVTHRVLGVLYTSERPEATLGT